jgi:hypothetical protein
MSVNEVTLARHHYKTIKDKKEKLKSLLLDED